MPRGCWKCWICRLRRVRSSARRLSSAAVAGRNLDGINVKRDGSDTGNDKDEHTKRNRGAHAELVSGRGGPIGVLGRASATQPSSRLPRTPIRARRLPLATIGDPCPRWTSSAILNASSRNDRRSALAALAARYSGTATKRNHVYGTTTRTTTTRTVTTTRTTMKRGTALNGETVKIRRIPRNQRSFHPQIQYRPVT